MNIKKRKAATQRVRPTREEPESASDSSDSEPTGVVRPGEQPSSLSSSRKRKRSEPEQTTTIPPSEAAADATVATASAPAQPDGINGAPSKTEAKVGPVKAASSIRMTTFTDFAPDVCKDYKKTGFCGYGDSCKFLHAREDYKQGWALDNEWDKAGKDGGSRPSGTVVASAVGKKQALGNDVERAVDEEEEERRMLEKIPFACTICEKPYTNPIVTRCGHYFCEACALKRFRRNPNCAVCGAGTGGVFNGAKKLKELLRKKREREEAKESEQVA